MGNAEILEHLLGHFREDRRGDGGSVVGGALGVVHDDGDGDGRVVDRRDAREGRDVHRLRIEVRDGVNLLRGSRLPSGRIAVELRGLAGAVEDNAFHHLAHLGRSQLGDDAMLHLRPLQGGPLRGGRHLRCGRLLDRVQDGTDLIRHENSWRKIGAAICDRRHHGDELHGCHADFLADGDRADRRAVPSVCGAQQTAGFAGKFQAGAAAEAEVANVLIEAIGADLEGHLDGGDVAGAREGCGNGYDAHAAVAFVIVNHTTGESDLSTLAIDHVVGFCDLRIDRGGVGDQLEDRAGFVNVADGVVLEQLGRGVAKVVGVECGADREGKNLASVHVLHHDGAVVGVGPLHRMIEGILGHELNVLVDGELKILAGVGFMLDGAENMTTGVDGGEHAAGCAVKAGVEFLLETAETVVVEANVAERLRGDVAVGVEALKFLLEIEAVEVQSADMCSNFGRDTASDPGKTAATVKAFFDLVFGGLGVGRIDVGEAGEGARVGGLVFVFDFVGNGVDGVDLHGHGELAHVAVVEDAAAWRDLKGALLLLLRAFNVFRVVDDLEPEEADGDGERPEEEEGTDEPEASPLHERGAGCCAARARGAKGAGLHDGGGRNCTRHLVYRSLSGGWGRDCEFRVHRRAGICMRGGVHDLAGQGSGKTHLVSEAIDAAGLRKLCFGETELAILFAELIELLFFRFDTVGAFDGAEVLQAVDHDQREEHGDGGREDAHLAHAHGIGCFDQAGVIEVPGKHDLRSADAAAAHSLLREQLGVAVGNGCGPGLRGAQIECGRACRHRLLLTVAGFRVQRSGVGWFSAYDLCLVAGVLLFPDP